jgi:hypothetical protein
VLGGGKAVPEQVLEGRNLRELMEHYPRLGYTLKDHQRQEGQLRQYAPIGPACTASFACRAQLYWHLFAQLLRT